MEDKKRNYTELQLKFLDAFADPHNGGDYRTCMRIAGYSDTVAIREITKSLRDEILDLTRDMLVVSGPKAAATVVNALHSGNEPGTANSLKAAQMIFDRAGVVVKSDSIDLKVPSTGLIIMPAKKASPEDEDS